MSLNLSEIAILNIKASDYRCIISLISKNGAIELSQNSGLTEKSGTLQIKKYIKYLKSYIKMENTIKKFRDIEILKQKFYRHKRPISIKNIDINKSFNKVTFG